MSANTEFIENFEDQKITEPDENYVIKEEDILGFREKPHIGIVIFVLLSMSSITFFVNLFVYNNTNPLKVVILIFPILYSNRLFIGMFKILSKYKFRSILRLSMLYFDKQFVQSVVKKHSLITLPHHRLGVDDFHDNLIYVGQLFKDLEQLCYNLTVKMWPYIFGTMLAYKFLLYSYISYSQISPDQSLQPVLLRLIGNLLTRFSKDKQAFSNQIIVSELTMAQVILILLVIETVALLHYSKMNSRML